MRSCTLVLECFERACADTTEQGYSARWIAALAGADYSQAGARAAWLATENQAAAYEAAAATGRKTTSRR
jgi:hypothetical protein